MVVGEAGERHRNAKLVGRAQHQARVFESERQLEAGGAERAATHALAVRLVDGRREERAVQRLEHVEAIHAGLLHEREDLPERLEHRQEQEVSRELHEIRPARVFPHARDPAAERLQQGQARLHRVAVSGRPNTGAATYRAPRRWCASASRRAVAGSTVLIATWMASRSRAPSRPCSPETTPSRALSSETMVTTIRARAPAAAGDSAHAAPSATSGSAFAFVRLWTVKGNPARRRLRAMGRPMFPNPITATRSSMGS